MALNPDKSDATAYYLVHASDPDVLLYALSPLSESCTVHTVDNDATKLSRVLLRRQCEPDIKQLQFHADPGPLFQQFHLRLYSMYYAVIAACSIPVGQGPLPHLQVNK